MATFTHACPTAGCDWWWVFIAAPVRNVAVRCPLCGEVTSVEPGKAAVEPPPEATAADVPDEPPKRRSLFSKYTKDGD